MNTPLLVRLATLACFYSPAQSVFAQTPLGSSFSYQGKLEQSGLPVNGLADLEFRLFSAAAGGTQIGATQPFFDVAVVDGLFTIALDFGAGAFSGDARWLQISVRTAEGAPFTTLSPRQPLAATPYALHVPGIDGHSLDAADGSPTDALFVNTAGNVGIGTTTPVSKLEVNGSINAGPDGLASRNGARVAALATSGTYNDLVSYGAPLTINHVTPQHVFICNGGGNVGIGTTTPAARLDVRGNIKLGPSGQYFASSGEENLRMIRGTVDGDGTVLHGSGFTVVRTGEGGYRIYFSTPFVDVPSVTATAFVGGLNDRFVQIFATTTTYASLFMTETDGAFTDSDFSFSAIGPR